MHEFTSRRERNGAPDEDEPAVDSLPRAVDTVAEAARVRNSCCLSLKLSDPHSAASALRHLGMTLVTAVNREAKCTGSIAMPTTVRPRTSYSRHSAAVSHCLP